MFRGGAIKDSANLSFIFESMGYRVEEYEYRDLKRRDFIDKLENIRRNKEVDLTKFDSFILFCLSHGFNNNFLTYDKQEVGVSEIISPFKDEKCPVLAGKPKIVFLNFCRGNTNELNTSVLQSDDFNPGVENTAFKDTIIHFASQKNFTALRDTGKGTLFVQSICKVLEEYAHSTHLLDMEKLFSNEMTKNKATTTEIQILGFCKDFYFNPK